MTEKFGKLYEMIMGMVGSNDMNMGVQVQRNFPDPESDTGYVDKAAAGQQGNHKDITPEEEEKDKYLKYEDLGNGMAIALENEDGRFEVVIFDIDKSGKHVEKAEHYFDEQPEAEELFDKLVAEYRGANES